MVDYSRKRIIGADVAALDDVDWNPSGTKVNDSASKIRGFESNPYGCKVLPVAGGWDAVDVPARGDDRWLHTIDPLPI